MKEGEPREMALLVQSLSSMQEVLTSVHGILQTNPVCWHWPVIWASGRREQQGQVIEVICNDIASF